MLQLAVAELMHPVTPQHCNTVFLHPEIKISAPKSKTSRLGSSTLTTAIWPEERKAHLQKCEVQLFSPSASFLFFTKQKRRGFAETWRTPTRRNDSYFFLIRSPETPASPLCFPPAVKRPYLLSWPETVQIILAGPRGSNAHRRPLHLQWLRARLPPQCV